MGSETSVTVSFPTQLVMVDAAIDVLRRGACDIVVVMVTVEKTVDCAIVRVTVIQGVLSCVCGGVVGFGLNGMDKTARSRMTIAVEITAGPVCVEVVNFVKF